MNSTITSQHKLHLKLSGQLKAYKTKNKLTIMCRSPTSVSKIIINKILNSVKTSVYEKLRKLNACREFGVKFTSCNSWLIAMDCSLLDYVGF